MTVASSDLINFIGSQADLRKVKIETQDDFMKTQPSTSKASAPNVSVTLDARIDFAFRRRHKVSTVRAEPPTLLRTRASRGTTSPHRFPQQTPLLVAKATRGVAVTLLPTK